MDDQNATSSVSAFTPSIGSQGKGKERQVSRGFSPSAPALASDEGESEEEGSQDSSDGEVEGDEEELYAPEGDGEDMDDGETIGGLGNTSAPPTPYPISSRYSQEASSSRRQVGTSRFDVQENFNLWRISEDQLDQAGMHGSGPGIVISLSHEEVSDRP